MWLTDSEVADYLGIIATGDTRLPVAVAAAQVWVERSRPDLDWASAPPADVHLGGILMAALLYQSGASPSGMPSFDDLGSYDDTGANLAQIYRLIGSRRPVVL